MENHHFPQQNEANQMNNWSAYMNQPVKVSVLDGKSYEGIMEAIDGEQVHLLIPINIPEGVREGEDRAFGYPGVGGWGYPGYGYPGGYASPYGYGFGYGRRPFGRLTLPFAALTALTLI